MPCEHTLRNVQYSAGNVTQPLRDVRRLQDAVFQSYVKNRAGGSQIVPTTEVFTTPDDCSATTTVQPTDSSLAGMPEDTAVVL